MWIAQLIGYAIWLISMIVIWFISDHSIYLLIFCATGLISFLIMNNTSAINNLNNSNAINNYCETPRFLANQLASINNHLESLNEKMDTTNEVLESISLNSQVSSEED